MQCIEFVAGYHFKSSATKAIVDYTSHALCTSITPFPADPIFSERGNDGMIDPLTA